MKVAVKSDTQIDVMKCAELKAELKMRGLRTTGNKSQLVERLKAAVLVERARAEDEDADEDEEKEEEDEEDKEADEDEEQVEEVYEDSASIKVKQKKQLKKPTVQLTVRDVEELLEKFSGTGYPSVQ